MTDAARLITGADFVGISTQDLATAVEFYGSTLGLRRSVSVFADPDGNALLLHHRYAPRVTEA
jgi:catechol 2,3-dioxygenase-like lactoylglutathione lyase family enzyme